MISLGELVDSEFIKWLTTLGVGGTLAGVMFFWYRKDIIQKSTDAEFRENQLIEVIKTNASSHERLALSMQSLSDALKHAESTRIVQLQALIEQVIKKQ